MKCVGETNFRDAIYWCTRCGTIGTHEGSQFDSPLIVDRVDAFLDKAELSDADLLLAHTLGVEESCRLEGCRDIAHSLKGKA